MSKLFKVLLLFLIVIFIAILISACWLIFKKSLNPNLFLSMVKINNIKISVEVAKTASEKTQGLSNRNKLNQNVGMIFVYQKTDYYQIGMKNMNFSIDVIWIDENYQIIDIDKNISPDSYPASFKPSKPVKYFIEIAAGFCDANKIKIGNKVEFSELINPS